MFPARVALRRGAFARTLCDRGARMGRVAGRLRVRGSSIRRTKRAQYTNTTMKRLIRWLVILGVIGGLIYAASGPVAAYWKERKRVTWRETEVNRGRIVANVKSTGTINPVRSIKIGCFVSGPIESIFVDFNVEVKKGDLMAKIDPRLYEAAVARDKATLANQKATVEQTRAQLQQAINDENRAKRLRAENKDFISD